MDDKEITDTPRQEEVQQEHANSEEGFPHQEIDVNSRKENPILDMFG